MNEPFALLFLLLVALGIGLLIGIERGWQERDSEEGQRVAGVRTYGLLGLLGGSFGILTQQFGGLILGLGFAVVSLMFGSMFILRQQQLGKWGMTSLVAVLLTFILAALAAVGQALVAVALTVITLLILNYKPTLHRWVSHLKNEEIKAAITLLLMTVVLLPVLPDQGFGPWYALNPYKIWLMVIIIATISFTGYFAVKWGGAQKGILFTGVFGGLASSTAVTLHLSRLGKQHVALSPVIASGILIACGTMYFRILILTAMLAPMLLSAVWWPMLIMASVTYFPLMFYRHNGDNPQLDTNTIVNNPLELKTALIFGTILTLVMLLSVMLNALYGDDGVLTLAAVSGFADVDAIILSLLTLVQQELSISVFVICCVVAAASNSLLKAVLCSVIGGKTLFRKAALPLMLSAFTGISLVLILMA